MDTNRILAIVFLVGAFIASAPADAARRTVCTITVNSPDEKQAFRRYLPESQYDFVELVERGRPDWLDSACRKGVRCDVLVVSGHFNGTQFLSDQIEAQEYLPVREMERASCSNACPALFSQLKEVYLFGCDTLNKETMLRATPEMVRSLVRSGHAEADARRIADQLAERYAESNRDIMRRVFTNVPVIYGFYSTAPLGPTAAPILSRYLQNASSREIASGHPSSRLLGMLGANHLTAVEGLRDGDRRASYRADACRFVDDHLAPAQKLAAVRALLDREMAEVRLALDGIERYVNALDRADRSDPAVGSELDAISRNTNARARWLAFARDADEPRTRARMIAIAERLGWLPGDEYRAELTDLVRDLLARASMSASDVDLVCTLPEPAAIHDELHAAGLAPSAGDRPDRVAALACLGSAPDRARVLTLLTSADDHEVQMAQVYFKHRPMTAAAEVRAASNGIARMRSTTAQVRALETLARHAVPDPETVDVLTRLFAATPSLDVQRAVAGFLIRSDFKDVNTPDNVAMLQQHRLKSPDGHDIIDVLLRRMQMN